MSSKLGILLSLIFLTTAFLFGSDLISLQYLYSELDAKAITIGYLMSKRTTIDQNFISAINEKYEVIMTYNGAIQPAYGEVVSYKISKKFNPIVISNQQLNVSVNRSTVIGYFG